MIIDYSFWRPDPAKDLGGVRGVIRYLAHDNGKAASIPEIAELHAHGISTAVVFEDAADRAAAGAAAGDADGTFAADQAVKLGVPRGRPVYVSVDFDIPDYAPSSSDAKAKLGPVGAYLEAFAAKLAGPGYPLGVYGGYWCVTRAWSAAITRWAWTTPAWSGTNFFDDVSLYQVRTGLYGGNADLNLAGTADWGQWRRATVTYTGAAA